MQYTCWLITETWWEPMLGAMHLAHTESMIEKCRRTLTALWVVSFSLSSSLRPRESSSLPFIWFSWVGAPCLVNPILISPLFWFPNIAAFQPPVNPPRSGPHDPASLMSQQDIPGVSALSLIVSRLSLLLLLHPQSDSSPVSQCQFCSG